MGLYPVVCQLVHQRQHRLGQLQRLALEQVWADGAKQNRIGIAIKAGFELCQLGLVVAIATGFMEFQPQAQGLALFGQAIINPYPIGVFKMWHQSAQLPGLLALVSGVWVRGLACWIASL